MGTTIKWLGGLWRWGVEWSKWSSLRALAESRFVRASALWVVAVPVAAKIVLALRERVTSPEWAAHAVASLSLPFSWQCLFLASLMCLIANVVFDGRCPKIIREQVDFGGFSAAGKQTTHVIEYLREQGAKRVSLYQDGFTRLAEAAGGLVATEDHELFTCAPTKSLYPHSGMRMTDLDIDEKVGVQAAFWRLRDHAESLRAGSRRTAVAFYLAGLLIYAYVFGQNLWWVAKAILG